MMKRQGTRKSVLAVAALIAIPFGCGDRRWSAPEHFTLFACDRLTADEWESFHDLGTGSLVLLRVEERDALAEVATWAEQFAENGIRVGYWIEVARSPSLADAQPNLMASLQGHDEWRALFPDAAQPREGEVVKIYPWVPITTREGFDAQLARVTRILAALPAPSTIYLNDLQSAPSSCGCGHPTCRWATDYFVSGSENAAPLASGTALGPEAAADFVDAVKAIAKDARVVPVWTAECTAGDERCHGVPCFEGACWPALAKSWAPIVERNDTLAVFVPWTPLARPWSEQLDVERSVHALTRIEREGAPRVQVNRSRIVAIVERRPIDTPYLSWEPDVELVASWTELEQGWEPRVIAMRR